VAHRAVCIVSKMVVWLCFYHFSTFQRNCIFRISKLCQEILWKFILDDTVSLKWMNSYHS